MDHDHGYKRLFSHPDIMADLLRGFVKDERVTQLDFSTLEKVNGSYISNDLREWHDDIIWRIRWRQDQKSNQEAGGKEDQGNGWLYVYLLLELQATMDWFMVVHVMTYVGLLYQDLITGSSAKLSALPSLR